MADSYVIRQGTERNTNPMFMEIMAKDLTELAKYASKCTPGSLGYLEDATVYRLGTQGTWVKVGEDVPSRLNTLTSQLAEIADGSGLDDGAVNQNKIPSTAALAQLLHAGSNANLYDKRVALSQGYIAANGDFTSAANFSATGKIYLVAGVQYTVVADWGALGEQYKLHFYEADDTHIGYASGATANGVTVTAPADTCYCRMSFTSTANADATMIVVGASAPSNYVPYGVEYGFLRLDVEDIGNYDYGNVFEASLHPTLDQFVPLTGSYTVIDVTPHDEFSSVLNAQNVVGLPFDENNDAAANAYYFNYYLPKDGNKSYNLSDLGLAAGDTVTFGMSAYCNTEFVKSHYWFEIMLLEYTSAGVYIKNTTTDVIIQQNKYTRLAKTITLSDTTGRIALYFRLGETITSGNTVSAEVCNVFVMKGAPVKQFVINSNDKIANPFAGKRILFMGDSITANESRWVTDFLSIVKPSTYLNVAQGGATWRDYSDTTAYNGVLTPTGYQNVIGNQVQHMLENSYNAPDIIIIAAGTNDATDVVDLESQFTSAGAYIDVDTCDRESFAGAIRWCVEKLQGEYPNAKIFITTPLQTAEAIHTFATQKQKADSIKAAANRLSIPVFDSFMESGIYGAYEINGSDGKYLIDGIHTNAAGAAKLATYHANKLKAFYS